MSTSLMFCNFEHLCSFTAMRSLVGMEVENQVLGACRGRTCPRHRRRRGRAVWRRSCRALRARLRSTGLSRPPSLGATPAPPCMRLLAAAANQSLLRSHCDASVIRSCYTSNDGSRVDIPKEPIVRSRPDGRQDLKKDRLKAGYQS